MIKTATSTAQIEHLPVEIIVQVFLRVRDATPDDPDTLDRLRLVCRFWNRAVLDSPVLWSTIRLKVGFRSIEFWLQYTLKCLRLAGPTCPLDIGHDGATGGKWWAEYPDRKTGYETYCKLIIALVGEKGETAARWRSAYFAGNSWVDYAHDHFFAFSTPRLEVFNAENLAIRHGVAFLPHAPSLRHLQLRSYTLPTLRDLLISQSLTLQTLELRWVLDIPQLLAFPGVTSVSTLNIGGDVTYKVDPKATVLTTLRDLTIIGTVPKSLEHFSIPNLETLCLQSPSRGPFQVFKYPGIAFSRIRTLRLECSSPFSRRVMEVTEIEAYLPSFLTTFSGLELLEVCCDSKCAGCECIISMADKIFMGRVTIVVSCI